MIHSEGSQTEDKKQAEQKQQMDVLACASKKGSMTQEIFCNFCKHFVALLPEERDPVILFLDGHASRWNTQALKCPHDHNVFAFFFASHTSIWAQRNNCGSNKRVHWAIEQANKKIRCWGASTT
jgi:hypothetical protein